MGTRQPSEQRRQSAGSRPSVSVEVEGELHGSVEAPESGLDGRERADRGGRVLAVCALFVLLAVVGIAITTTGSTEDETAVPQATISSSVAPGPVESTAVPATAVPIVDQLPTTPDELVDGLALAWVDDTRQLHLEYLSNGDPLGVSRLARTNLPPLPERIHLIGAENSTWLVDLKEPANSGELSNTVRMVRLGQDLDSYAFISSSPGEDTQFFVGSLWGPSMAGTARAPESAEVIAVPRRGIVVASQAAESAVLLGDGLDPLPRRLGRIVAASRSLVIGIFCDDLGRCIGRVAGWDGAGEIEIWADALGAPVVRISPNENYVLTAGGETWTLYDLAAGTRESWTSALRANETLTWSPDSRSVFWIDGQDVLSHSVIADRRQLSRVRQFGQVGDRMPGSDVALHVVE